MKMFKIFFALFVVVLLIFVVSLFFPGSYRIERTITIDRSVADVYGFMGNFRNWERWSLWNKDNDSTLYYFYGKDGTQYFHGERLGEGRFRFDEKTENQKLVYNLYMHGGQVNAHGTFLFRDAEKKSMLTWLDSGEVGYNPIFRFMIPAKVSETERNFDDGLRRIKEIVEGKELKGDTATVNQ